MTVFANVPLAASRIAGIVHVIPVNVQTVTVNFKAFRDYAEGFLYF